MESEYGRWTIYQLKKELRRRNARVSGRKADLVERLDAYDRNSNFGGDETVQPEYQMQLPPVSDYKDVHAGMSIPALTVDQANDFLSSVGKDLDKKATELYSNKYVNYIRACETPALNSVYIRAEVRAEMKANVAYKTDICLSSEGVILQCQCECAAGMGPSAHCKHIQCILFGLTLTEFKTTKTFLTLTTCTQVLQTFHQAKKHLGSPVKAECLAIHKKKLESFDFDPRPPQFRNMSGYSAHFKAVIQNSGVFSGAPIQQIFHPANPYAIIHDHDYLSEDPRQVYLKSAGLLDVPEQQIQCIERDTVSNRKLWREERRKRLCSSDFGTICKYTVKTNVHKLRKRFLSDRDISAAPILHGRKYERVAVHRYEELKGVQTTTCGLFVSPAYPFLGSTPDRLISTDKLLEVKCPFSSFNKDISPVTVPYLEMKDGDLALKRDHDYFYQVQGQMFCVGGEVKEVDFVVYTGKDITVITVQ